MRVYCLRHRIRVGDRLVLVDANEDEYTTAPITWIGDETVILEGGAIVPYPGKGVYVERDVSSSQLLAGLEEETSARGLEVPPDVP